MPSLASRVLDRHIVRETEPDPLVTFAKIKAALGAVVGEVADIRLVRAGPGVIRFEALTTGGRFETGAIKLVMGIAENGDIAGDVVMDLDPPLGRVFVD